MWIERGDFRFQHRDAIGRCKGRRTAGAATSVSKTIADMKVNFTIFQVQRKVWEDLATDHAPRDQLLSPHVYAA
jgi:hypothetical protein